MFLGIVLAMALAGCGQPGAAPAAGAHSAAAPSRGRVSPRGRVSSRVAAIVRSMTLPQKVGQLLVPTVPGLSAADGGTALVRRYHVGGVIYFGQNIRGAAQVAVLSAGLQQAARGQPPHLPLLIGTDQEGGIVSRLAGVTTVFPGQMAAGATRDPALISGAGRGHRGGHAGAGHQPRPRAGRRRQRGRQPGDRDPLVRFPPGPGGRHDRRRG